MPPLRHLEQIQRWMQAVITHPAGVAAGVRSTDAQQHLPIRVEQVDSVILPSARLTSVERLEVYASAYYARLLECLRDEFAALVQALGPEAFDGFAFGYLQASPSGSYTLAELGRGFPGYLAETRPSGDNTEPGWPDFLIELAGLERIYSEVFDGEGIEGIPTLQRADLADISPAQWPEARLVPVPCLRLVRLSFPVHEYISAVRKKATPVIPKAATTYLVITRRDYVVRRCAVSHEEFTLLENLVAGETVGGAIRNLAEQTTVDLERLAEQLREWFAGWAAAGYFLQAVL
jgi:hypothetical protein